MMHSCHSRSSSWPRASTSLFTTRRSASEPENRPKQKSRPPQHHQNDRIVLGALVMQNIPFHVKETHLLKLIECQQLPTPSAINYFFERGLFKGTAFLNFNSHYDAQIVKKALNGLTVANRTLYVMYKFDPHAINDGRCRCKSDFLVNCGEEPNARMAFSQVARSCLETIDRWDCYRGVAPRVEIRTRHDVMFEGFYTQTKQYHGRVDYTESVTLVEEKEEKEGGVSIPMWWFGKQLELLIPFQNCQPRSSSVNTGQSICRSVPCGKALLLALKDEDNIEASKLLAEIFDHVRLDLG